MMRPVVACIAISLDILNNMNDFQDLVFPNLLCKNWQMMIWEQIALTGLLMRIKPKGALEVGTHHGGSLSLIAQCAEQTLAIDIDANVLGRFPKPANAEIWIGSSSELIPKALHEFQRKNVPLNFILVLVDADHSTVAIKRDLEMILNYEPREPLIVVMHDSGNPEARQGILSVDWSSNPHLHFMDCDFVPGVIVEHTVTGGRGEVWGGLALAYLDSNLRYGAPEIRQSAKTTIRAIQHCAKDLSIMD
jgi:Cephalosporin hydroxylase